MPNAAVHRRAGVALRISSRTGPVRSVRPWSSPLIHFILMSYLPIGRMRSTLDPASSAAVRAVRARPKIRLDRRRRSRRRFETRCTMASAFREFFDARGMRRTSSMARDRRGLPDVPRFSRDLAGVREECLRGTGEHLPAGAPHDSSPWRTTWHHGSSWLFRRS